jgi:hypothetical protein
MKTILILAVLGCGGSDSPHDVVRCVNSPDGQCERACVGVDPNDFELMCTIGFTPMGDPGTCSPVTVFEGVAGCCRDFDDDDLDALAFRECLDEPVSGEGVGALGRR